MVDYQFIMHVLRIVILSWMIDENIFDINCKTKYSRKKEWNGETPLYNAIYFNSVKCVAVLCKQSFKNLVITKKDVVRALYNDNVSILKFLLCRIFKQYEISSMKDILKQPKDSIISSNAIEYRIKYCNKHKYKKCHTFLKDLFVKGYSKDNFNFIVFKLDYDLKTVINDDTKMTNDDELKASDDYTIEKNLGKGTFGLVQLGINKRNGNKVAIKHITFNKNTSQFITSEIESLKKLSTHKNIINLLNYQICIDTVLLYFEYCLFGDLYSLLKQSDFFSMRISFKYFTQLLSAINTCHKMNIVHRDLKLQNILISDTFQLKVADFGLASIVDSKNYDKIYNVGTPMYKSPELIEGKNSKYDIRNINVLKSSDVFSLSIIYWQMMNGIEYLPFKCYENNGINSGNYGLIKRKKFDKFWNLHSKCHMIVATSSNENDDGLLLLLHNLFEQMFEYDPDKRITISSILRHKYVELTENDVLFTMNDAQLEAFVRDGYHQTKNIQNKKHTKAPPTYRSIGAGSKSKSISGNIPSVNSNDKTSGVFPWLLLDSSQAQISPNASKVHADYNKRIFSFNPLVVMVGIQNNNKTNQNTIDRITRDYINVKQILHDIKHLDIVYHNSNHEIVHLRGIDNNNKKSAFSKKETIEKEFALSWTASDLDNFNNEIFDIVQNTSNNYKFEKYDCLIYIVSCHLSKHEKNMTMLYDSFENEYCCNSKVFYKFDNHKCSKLSKKAKIFVIDSHTTIVNHNNDHQEFKSDQEQTDYVKQYKRVVYANIIAKNDNSDDIKNDGGLLINSFCVSLCNNINDSLSKEDDHDDGSIKDLNIIIQETQSRIKKANVVNQIHDDNFIPKRCQIVFTSFDPLQSARYLGAQNNTNDKGGINILKTVAGLQQSDTTPVTTPIPDPVDHSITTK